LLPGIRAPLEKSLGADLQSIRVHGDSRSAGTAESMSARAFTVGTDVFLGPGQRPTDLALMAHEVAHVVQQRGAPVVQLWTSDRTDPYEQEAHRASAAVVRSEPFNVRGRTGPRVQRLGISDALNWFADKANVIPGFRMLTIILGFNPINMSRVDRSAANIRGAAIEFIPGGSLITQALANHGIFDKVGAWVEEQFKSLGLVGSAFKKAIDDFVKSLSIWDLGNLGGVWERAKRIFTDPIDRLLNFAKGLLNGIIKFIKDAILMPLAKLAEGTRGWDLLIAVLGKNPITGEPVPRNAETLIGGFLKLIGQEEVWNNMKKANALGRAWHWFQGAMTELLAFVRQIPTLAINAFKSLELVDIILVPRAFMKVAAVFGNFIGDFISWAGKAVWNLLEIIFDVVSPGAWSYIKKTGAALKSILKNPLPFVGNLVKAAKLGFQNFASNFLEHLKAGLIDWLTGSLPGVYIPKSFALVEIVKFVFSVLGLTWANVRQKLVAAIGETAVKVLETAFDIVVTLVKEGPAATWEKIKEQLSNLKDMVIGGITSMVIDMVVQKAVPKLIAMFIPGAGFISAIISIYDTIMVFVQKISQIIQVVKGFVDSIVAIAQGVITAAAQRVESTLARLLSLAINFLAGFAGLGKVADKVMEVIKKIRAPIDKALDALINWIVTIAKKLGKLAAQAGVPQDPKERLRLGLDAATAAVNTLRGPAVPVALIVPLLAAIKVRYGLKVLQPIEKDGDWWIEAVVNPPDQKKTQKKKGSAGEIKPMPQVAVEFFCNTLKYDLGEYRGQLKGQESGLNALPVDKWKENRDNYETYGRPAEAGAAQEAARELYRQELRDQGKSEPAIALEMAKLAALHEPDMIAGGKITLKKLGSRFINSSIGSQWRTKVRILDEAVKAVPESERPNLRMNVKLTVTS